MKVLLFTNFLKAYVNKRSKNKSTDKKTKQFSQKSSFINILMVSKHASADTIIQNKYFWGKT